MLLNRLGTLHFHFADVWGLHPDLLPPNGAPSPGLLVLIRVLAHS